MTCSQYDKIASVYDSIFSDAASIKENSEVGAMLSPLRGSVYEIGCGTGLLLDIIKDEGIELSNYRGVDPSIGMLGVLLSKHPEHSSRVWCGTFEADFDDNAFPCISYDNIVSIFGSISYVSKKYVELISHINCGKFLMFYKPDYHPVTYEKCNVEFSHNIYSKEWLSRIFKDCKVYYFNNYIIVDNLCHKKV